jgi:thiamine biosynthesis lipoprotein
VVTVAVDGLNEAAAHAAADAAFGAVARVHQLMSYHERHSELSRINRDAAAGPVAVDRATFEVLAKALALSQATNGVFDPTIAPRLEAAGILPLAEGPRPDPQASWRDIRLDAGLGAVAFDRPLRIDLGGIAKGYAVDAAIAALQAAGAPAGLVNAGGDLRCFGSPADVALRTGDPEEDGRCLLQLADAAAASSGALGEPAPDEPAMALHLASAGGPVIRGWFACVTAPECVLADALTKVVLARGAACEPILTSLGAQAHLIGPDRTWRSFGAQPCDG